MRWGTFFVLGTTFALTSLLPRGASADGPNTDVIIYLTGGKEIRGSVVEMVPGKHYVVLRSDGTTLKLPSSAVRAIAPPYGPPPPPESPAQKRSEPEPSGQDDVPPSASSASSAESQL